MFLGIGQSVVNHSRYGAPLLKIINVLLLLSIFRYTCTAKLLQMDTEFSPHFFFLTWEKVESDMLVAIR